jgi:hypothetical protein
MFREIWAQTSHQLGCDMDPVSLKVVQDIGHVYDILAQTQHLNHEPQTACNTLSSNESWRGDLLGHREPLTGVR